MTFNKYFNDARDDDIEKCKDDTIKKARDKITYMAETINDNIKTSTDMVSTSSKLKSLIIDYNNFINHSLNVKDWSSGHQNILKLTGKYSTLLSNLIKRDKQLKKQCDEKMKQPPQHPLKPIIKYFSTLKQITNHFYLPAYVVLKLLRYQDLTFKAKKHAEGLQHNIKLNTILQVNGSQRRREAKLFKNFFKFITTNFNISIQNDATLNQNIHLSNTPANIEAIDKYIETMESFLKYFKQNDIPSSASLAKAILTQNEVKTYENIRKHFEFINERAFALGEYFNFILISPAKQGKRGDHLKVSNFKKYIDAIRKKLLGGIQTKYNTPPPPSSSYPSSSKSKGVSSFEDQFITKELPQQQRNFDEELYDRNVARGAYIPKPTRRAPSRPPTYNPETIITDYSDREAQRAIGATKPLPPMSSSTLPPIDLSSLDKYSQGRSFKDRNKQVSRQTRKKRFNTGAERNTARSSFRGGKKTRKNNKNNKNNKNTKRKQMKRVKHKRHNKNQTRKNK